MNIITITLNPAFDIHCFCESFSQNRENLANITAKDAGGKGINISRALAESGASSTALVVLGDENGDDFLRALSGEKMNVEKILTPGRIRENITIHTKENKETRLSFPGFSADNSLLDSVKSIIESKLTSDTVITFTGSIPGGISLAAVKEMLCGFFILLIMQSSIKYAAAQRTVSQMHSSVRSLPTS